MLLAHKTSINLNNNDGNIIGHMCYAAYKLWNVCNYERLHYQELDLPVAYPDWYYQKKFHKDDIWYKQLPSQTAQEVCKILDKSWKSFYKLQKTGGIKNPGPPRFKHENMPITCMQNGMKHEPGSSVVRLSLPKQLMGYMKETYNIDEKFIYLENKIFKDMDVIKQIKLYPPEDGICFIIALYEVPAVDEYADNGKYLSIDLGLHNLMTCFASESHETFIIGRKYLSLCHYYNKEIARIESQWSKQQSLHGVKYPKLSKHAKRLYAQKNNAVSDYLHKITTHIVSYCVKNDIHTLVIGDITNIRRDKDYGRKTNQKLHALPYKKIYILLQYKCQIRGIRFIMQNEAYSSQCSPLEDNVSKATADKSNRVKRGLYVEHSHTYNADVVGAYNILRLYLQTNNITKALNPYKIKVPYVMKVAV